MANSQQRTSQIKLISKCFIKPKYQLESSKQPYFLGPVDLLFLPLDPLQKGLLFPTKPENIDHNLLQKLAKSLSISLVHYYPLAGQFATENFPDEDAVWVYIDCKKGPGARLIHATVDLTVGDLLSSVDVHPIVQSLFDLGEKSINRDGNTRPLLSVQVTELHDGIFIGFTMNHSVVDGTTQWSFISALSKIFLQLDEKSDDENNIISAISRKPIFTPFFPDGYGPILKLPRSLEEVFKAWMPDYGPLRERIFHFSSTTMSKLKAKANAECQVQVQSITISSFQALSALVWRSITRARKLEPDLETTFVLPMNARPRLNPPLSDDYFGNFIIRGQKKCEVGDVLGNDFGWAALFVHRIVSDQDDEATRGFFQGAVKIFTCGAELPFMDSPNLVVIGGSARFDMYGPEFGLGRALAVYAGYGNKEDGKVTASPGRDGGGSVDLEICLRPDAMNALEMDEEFMSFVTLV